MLMKIGELATRTGATVETIRYYEKEKLLPEPSRSQGNYRLYREEHIERLQFILHCREVNSLLDEHIQAVEDRIEELMQLKQHLLVLRQKCAREAQAESCGILNALADNSCHE